MTDFTLNPPGTVNNPWLPRRVVETELADDCFSSIRGVGAMIENLAGYPPPDPVHCAASQVDRLVDAVCGALRRDNTRIPMEAGDALQRLVVQCARLSIACHRQSNDEQLQRLLYARLIERGECP